MKPIRSISVIFILPLLISGKTTYAQVNERALLWEISGNGSKKPSYLYGTIHIQSSRVFEYDKIVEDKIKACDGFAMEVILDELNPSMLAKATVMEGTTLDKLLTPAEFEKVDAYFKAKTGIPLATFNMMKPFLVYSQLMLSGMPQEKPVPLDMHLLAVAREHKKKTSSIETFEDQMGAINTISLEEQAKMLVKMVDDTTGENHQFKDMVDTYLQQDIDKMIVMTKDPSLPKEFNENFLVKRNRKMADTLHSLIQKQPTFSAVGAAHLGGTSGLIILLRQAGYEVKPVYFNFK